MRGVDRLGWMRAVCAWAKDEAAASVHIFALSLLPLLVFLGAALDFRRADIARVELQSELDSLLFRTASQGQAGFTSAAEAEAESVMSTTSASGFWAVETKQFWTSVSASGTEYHGRVEASVPTTLLGLAAINHIPVSVSSAVLKAEETSVPCITLVDPSATHALRINSGARILAPDCSVHVLSAATQGAVFNTGSDLEFDEICLRSSGALINGPAPANLQLDCAPAAPPSPAALPHPSAGSCTHNNLNINGGDVVLQPGVYCGWTNFNASPNVTLNPGLYVIQGGGWNVNGGNFTGDGVTFYYADTSKIQFNTAVSAALNAPATGPYKDILMFEAAGLTVSDFALNDSPTFELAGAIYLPSRNAYYNSGSQQVSRRMTMVFNQLVLNQTDWQLEPATSGPPSGMTGNEAATLRLIH